MFTKKTELTIADYDSNQRTLIYLVRVNYYC